VAVYDMVAKGQLHNAGKYFIFACLIIECVFVDAVKRLIKVLKSRQELAEHVPLLCKVC
jgi:hypothetical protein